MDSESSASRRNWVGLVVISVAVSLIIVDSTIVNVAVPSVVRDLRISSTQVQWVQESYTLVFASLLLVFGTLADRFGRRRMLIVGTAIFALSSIAAALSPTGDLLILSRVVQGVGGAMILPTTLSLINATFRGRDRGVAFAVWGSTIGGMAALGPLLGGWLTTDFSWRWAFAINLPLGVLIILGTVLFVQESRATEKRSIDVPGAVLSVVLFAGLVFGLIEGRTLGWWTTASKLIVGSFRWPWSLSPIPLAFGVALLALVAFILRARVRQRSGHASMLDLELLSIRSFRNGNIAAMIVSLGEFGVILSLPLWLQNVLGYSALQTGFTLLSLAIGSFVASGFGATAGQRFAPLWIVRAGILFEIAGLLVVALVIGTSTQWWQIAIGLFVYGFGVGLATAQLTGVILADVPTELSGQASGTQSTSRQIGSALGIAILGTVLFSSLGTGLSHRLSTVAAAQRTGLVDSVVSSSGTIIPSLARISHAVQVQAEEAFSDSTRWAALTAAGFLLLGLAATASLRKSRS